MRPTTGFPALPAECFLRPGWNGSSPGHAGRALHAYRRTHRWPVIAPSSQNSEKIPNEDSLSFEFDDTNLFSDNRFGGIDRVEGGSRVTYGLNSGIFGLNSGFSSFFIGQSFRFSKDNDFGTDTGLDDHFSDIVGRVKVSPHASSTRSIVSASIKTTSPPGVMKWKPPSACQNSG